MFSDEDGNDHHIAMRIVGEPRESPLLSASRTADERDIAHGRFELFADVIHIFRDDRSATSAIHKDACFDIVSWQDVEQSAENDPSLSDE